MYFKNPSNFKMLHEIQYKTQIVEQHGTWFLRATHQLFKAVANDLGYFAKVL